MKSIRQHLYNAQMNALAEGMAGLSMGKKEEMQAQLEELEEKMKELQSK